jgi:hypothetical protein
MVIKDIKMFHSKGASKMYQNWVFGLKINHLATLPPSSFFGPSTNPGPSLALYAKNSQIS